MGQIEKKWFLAANYSCAPKIIAYHLDAVLAYSLGKKGTSNKVTEKIEYLLKGGFIPPGSLLILSFGEIDCRVHVKRQAEINKVSQLEVILNIINNYIRFVFGYCFIKQTKKIKPVLSTFFSQFLVIAFHYLVPLFF